MVSLIVSGVFVLFLLVGFLLGLKRGLKRTAIRGAWLAVVVVLLFILSTGITMKLLGLPIGKWITLEVDGEKFVTLKDYLSAMLENKLALDGVDYTETVNVLFSLISMAINGVVFLVCFWVLHLITTLLYHFFNIFIFAGERRKKKQLKAEGKKLNKHRLAGAFVGMALGLVTFFCTITPLVGYITVAKSVEKRSAENYGTETGILTEYGGDTYTQIVNAYDESIAAKTFNALGLDKAMLKLMDLNSSVTINKQRVTLSTEAEKIVDIYCEVEGFKFPDLNTCTKEEMAKTLNSIDKIVDVVFGSKIVSVSADTVLPIAIRYAKKEVKTDDYKPYVKNFINACFDELDTFKSDKIKTEVKNVVNLVRTLNNNNLLLPIVQNDMGDAVIFMKNNLTKENTNEIVEAMFKLNTANEMAPHIVNFLLGMGADQLTYEFVDEDTITSTALKDASLTMLSSAVDALTCVDKKDGNYTYTINSTLAGALGGMFDAVKSLVSVNNFKSVANGLEPKLNEILADLTDSLPEFAKDAVTNSINNISEVTSFKETFKSAYEAYDIIKAEFDNAKTGSKYDVDKMNFVQLGRALDKIETNELLQGDIIKTALLKALDQLDEKKTDISETFKFTSIAKIKENINGAMGNGLDINWEAELPRYKTIVSLAVNLKNEKDLMAKVKQADDTTLETIGAQLDGPLKDSILLKNCDRLLVADILQYAHDKVTVSSDEKTNNSVKSMLVEAKANVQDDSRAPFTWKQEFKHIKSMLEVDFDNTDDANILVIAGKLDTILFDQYDEENVLVSEKSKIITSNMVNDFIVDYMDQVFGEYSSTESFYETVTKIKNGFRSGNISSYKTEFDALLKLKSCKSVVEGDPGIDFINTAQVKSLGEKIDSALRLKSVIVDKDLVNGYLIKVINQHVILNNQFDAIKTNIVSRLENDKLADDVKTYNITSYENEFEYLSKLSNISANFGSIEIDTIKTAKNSENKTVGQCFDDIADSILVGDAGYIVIKDALNNYKDDSNNSEYLSITNVICGNYDALENQMAFAPNLSGTKTINYVTLIDNLDEFYQVVGGDNKMTENVDLATFSSTQANNYDETLGKLQNNIVVKANGALEVAIFAVNKLKANAVSGTQVATYIETYSKYLAYVKSQSTIETQPYNTPATVNPADYTEGAVYAYTTDGENFSLTETTGATKVQISRPFEVIYALAQAGV